MNKVKGFQGIAQLVTNRHSYQDSLITLTFEATTLALVQVFLKLTGLECQLGAIIPTDTILYDVETHFFIHVLLLSGDFLVVQYGKFMRLTFAQKKPETIASGQYSLIILPIKY